MTSSVDALTILNRGHNLQKIVRQSVKLLSDFGCHYENDTMVVFNEDDQLEREPEVADTMEQAELMLGSWPLSGGTEFMLRESKLVSFFYGFQEHTVDAISLSISSAYFFKDLASRANFISVITRFHAEMKPLRTIVDVDLLSPGSKWREYVLLARSSSLPKAGLLDL
jgi:hypothetical protein